MVADYGELIEDHLFKDLNVRLLCFYPVLVTYFDYNLSDKKRV